ncbi:MAG: SDR family oxidoreductase [Acetobacteraceae bacterium]|nr:SDR family oxidoreductase [Acetobacteraceae bacterium]
MDLSLNGKTALVTGSTAGIGFAIARGLLEQGAAVWVNGRTSDRVQRAIAALRHDFPRAEIAGIAADLATAEGAAQTTGTLPAADILINNLGIYQLKPFAEITDQDWIGLFEVNVLSGIRLTRHYVTGMRARNWGRILFISSESATNIPADMIHYGMTKAAQLAVSRGVAEIVAGTNITVNAVLPGPTRSEGVEAFVEQMAKAKGITAEQAEAQFFQTERPTSLLKRFARVEEVANLVVYLSSPAASATTGAAVRVDGGVVQSIL